MLKDYEKFVEMYNDIEKYPTVGTIAEAFDTTDRSIRRAADKCRKKGIILIDRSVVSGNTKEYEVEVINDQDILTENVRLSKQLQKQQDLNRIKNKTWRDQVRVENTIEELDAALLVELKNFTLSKLTKQHKVKSIDTARGIMHISDVHLNELIDMPHNKYDWNIAAQRLKKHVNTAKLIFNAYGIKEVLVAFTGDLLNSDRRMDEIVGNAGNRSKALLLAIDLYQQALLDLNEDFNLTVASVTGNESRIQKDIGWNPEVSSDNYDFTIHECLRMLFKDSKGIEFICNTDPGEVVVKIGKQHILLAHGHGSIENKAPDRSILQMKGRYVARGIKVDMIIWGHIHSTIIGDAYARSSSMCGTNSYAENALGLSGRASQNLYIIKDDTGFDGYKCDLQHVDGIVGYNIQERLVSYNTKSLDKARKEIAIHNMS